MSSTIPSGPVGPAGALSPAAQAQREDLRRDVRATLEAQRELGPDYNDHFVQQLTERMMAQVRREMASAPAPKAPRSRSRLDAAQRTGLAICSLIFGIPLIAIAGGEIGLVGIVVVAAMIALINLVTAL